MGIPVVVTKVGALWEVVDDFNLGEIIKPGSSKAVADGIRNTFKNYGKHKAGISRYRKEASWEESGRKHLRLYKLVLKKKSL